VLEETSTTWKTSTMKEMMKAIDDDDERWKNFSSKIPATTKRQ